MAKIRHMSGKVKFSRFLLFAFFVILVSNPVVVLLYPSSHVYIYTFPEYQSTEMLLSYFNNKSDWIVTSYDLNNSTYSAEFLKIVYILVTEGVGVVPPEMCTPCELYHHTWDEIYQIYASPLILFFRNGRVSAITIATADYEVLDQAVMVDIEDFVKVFRRDKTYSLTGEDATTLLETSFLLIQRGEELEGERFYAYNDIHCPGCVQRLEPLLSIYRERVTVFDTRGWSNADRYRKIVHLVDFETATVPLVGFFRDERLVAIVSGHFSEEDWRTIVEAEYEGVPVYAGRNITPFKIIKEQNVTDSIAKLLMNLPLEKETEIPGTNINRLLPLIIMAAAIDAINPCEFYVLIVFLSLVFFRVGRKAILKAGLAFSIAIFIIYYLMGFGLLQLISYIQEARLLIVILGFSVGFRAVLNFVFGVFGLSLGLRDTIGAFLNRKFKRVPEFFSKRLSTHLRRASENPMMAFAIGVVASSFLLPCTSGPYLIALSLIANSETLLEGLSLLTVYNGIIITPFLAITLGVYVLKFKTSELKRWSSQKQKLLNLAAGLLMIFLSLYLLSTIIT
jgi:cytochrome c biogenesis protein CcdA